MKVPTVSPRCMVGTETGPMPLPDRPSFGKNRLEERTLIARAKVLQYVREYMEKVRPTTRPDLETELNSGDKITNLIWEWLPRDPSEIEATYLAHEQELYNAFMKYATDIEKTSDEPAYRLKQLAIYYYIYDHISVWYRDTGDIILKICTSKQLGRVTAMLQAAITASGKVAYNNPKARIKVVPR
jgi:hypothetical protein